MLSVTKICEFAYAHQLPNYAGPCRNVHGHTGILEVEIGDVDFTEGMIEDFKTLKEVIEEEILSQWDHSFINDIIANPTAENMVVWAVDKLKWFYGPSLLRVRLYETPTSYAEWRK